MNTIFNRRLESNRLLLRVVSEDDWSGLYKAVSCDRFPHDVPLKEVIQTEEDAKAWIDQAIQDWDDGFKFTWSICLLTEPDLALGQISLTKLNEDHLWQIEFWITPDKQYKGYAQETIWMILKTIFVNHPKMVIVGHAAIWNKASNRVLKKCGFKVTKMNRQAIRCRGKAIPAYEYLIDHIVN